MTEAGMDREEDERRLRDWAERLAAELGMSEVPIDIDAVLGLAGRVAHTVVRPAAPLSTFLVGYAAGLAVGSQAGSVPEDEIRARMATALLLAARL
jgi:hypothetical protein